MKSKLQSIQERLRLTREAVDTFLREGAKELLAAAELTVKTLQAGNKVLIFGNGGSAAEAQHIAAELVNRMLINRRPLPAIALTTDTSVLTSIGNDFSFQEVFLKQIQALGQPGDLAWALSTSGSSKNVLLALAEAGKIGMKRLGMTGKGPTAMHELCEVCLSVNADSTPVIQEVHLAAAHVICELVERELFPEGKDA